MILTINCKSMDNYEDVMQAIEKSTPELPKPCRFYWGACPDCGRPFNTKDNYCRWCGQRMDWGKDNA